MAPFAFMTKVEQPILIGRQARSVSELLAGIESVPVSSVYYHTHRFLEQQRSISPEPPNDFAYWVANDLGNEPLAERLASIDIAHLDSVEEIRAGIAGILRRFAEEFGDSLRAPDGEEFHFMTFQAFVLGTPLSASTVGELKECVRRTDVNSLRYHMFDARLRFGRKENDFSIWLRAAGKAPRADRIARLDPYTQTVEGLRRRIIEILDADEAD